MSSAYLRFSGLQALSIKTSGSTSLLAVSPNIIDVEYVPMLAHDKPDELRANLQCRINKAAAEYKYDLFLLSYGLCGNSTAGLTCPVKMIMPRIHDCCAMFMGSKERFSAAFGEKLSMRWCTSGYYERCYMDGGLDSYSAHSRNTYPEYQALVEKYGEEDADYVWDILHPDIETPEAAYIRIEGFEVPGYQQGFTELVEKQGKTVLLLEGDITFLRDLVNGPWDDARFLTVQPGQKIGAVYDMENVVAALDV